MKLRSGKIIDSIQSIFNVKKQEKVIEKKVEDRIEESIQEKSGEEILSMIEKLSLKEEIEKDFPIPVKIGEGTYGTAWHISPQKVRKVCSLYEEDEDGNNLLDFSAENLCEGMFLRSFHPSFIGYAHKVEVVGDKIQLTEKYSGNKFRRTSEKDFKKLPHILIQMGRILMWMERHHIVHMDIKPGNLCLEDNKLSLIDWGFVTMKDRFQGSPFHGTSIFADPVYLSSMKNPDYSYDMFGMGMCIDFFMKDSYLPRYKWQEWENLRYFDASRTEKMFKLLKMNLLETLFKTKVKNGEKYLEIFKRMIDVNEETRLKPSELYYHPFLAEFRELYPLEEHESLATPMKTLKYNEQLFSKKDMKEINNFIREHENPDVTQDIMNRYLNKVSKKSSELKAVAISSIYLIKCLSGNSISLTRASKISGIDIKIIHDTILDILDKLEWRLYPNN